MFIDENHDRSGVEPISRTLEVSASVCYERAKGNRSASASPTSACSAGSSWSTPATTSVKTRKAKDARQLSVAEFGAFAIEKA